MCAKTKEKVAKALKNFHSKQYKECHSFKYPLRCWDVFAMFMQEERQNTCPIQKVIKKKFKS